jgi:hypothetical protein
MRHVGPQQVARISWVTSVEKSDALIQAWRVMATARLAGRIDTSQSSRLRDTTP